MNIVASPTLLGPRYLLVAAKFSDVKDEPSLSSAQAYLPYYWI